MKMVKIARGDDDIESAFCVRYDWSVMKKIMDWREKFFCYVLVIEIEVVTDREKRWKRLNDETWNPLCENYRKFVTFPLILLSVILLSLMKFCYADSIWFFCEPFHFAASISWTGIFRLRFSPHNNPHRGLAWRYLLDAFRFEETAESGPLALAAKFWLHLMKGLEGIFAKFDNNN